MSKNIDSLIKDIFEEEIENIDYPPSDEIWQQIRSKYSDGRMRMLLNNLMPSFAANILHFCSSNFIYILSNVYHSFYRQDNNKHERVYRKSFKNP